MFINYKKLYENLVNEIEELWNNRKTKFSIAESRDISEFDEGYFNTLSDFYVDYLSKYKVRDKMNNIKIINYRKRYMDESKFYGPFDEYVNGFLDCARDLLAIIY